MIRQWFDTTEVVEFASSIVRDAHALLDDRSQKGRAKVAKKAGRKLDSILARTRAFGAQHKLNVYKKAKLLNTVKWGLREAGHTDADVDEIVGLLAPLL
jgi:hypothetical protein